jgi:hypothetical protein
MVTPSLPEKARLFCANKQKVNGRIAEAARVTLTLFPRLPKVGRGAPFKPRITTRLVVEKAVWGLSKARFDAAAWRV